MDKILEILCALSDRTRLKIFLYLVSESLCVCELINILDMKQARISRMMKKLKDAGLVDRERRGKWIIYSANPEALKTGIVRGLMEDKKLSVSDMKRLRKCKKEGVRESCCK